MLPPVPDGRPLRVAFALLQDFSLMAFSSAFEPLRVANRMAGGCLYDWVLHSVDGRPVSCSGGLTTMVDADLSVPPGGETQRADVLIVISSFEPEQHCNHALRSWLCRAASSGMWVVGVDTGPHLLAAAGLLDGYQATAHWEHLDVFQQHYPAARLTQDVFVIDRKRWTTAGGTACLDLMLNLIRQQHGHDLATAVSDQFIYSRIRSGDDTQRMQLRDRLAVSNARVLESVAIMEANLEEPIGTGELALAVGVSLRELERLFRRWLKTTPGAYYRQLRLEKGRSLLQQSSQSITEIAVVCGFGSVASFSRAFKLRFGQPPSASRTLLLGF